MKKIIGVFCLFVSTCVCAENIYDVQKFGATNTGKELVTTCLQNAIDACYKAGGGVVYFPAGEYLSATLQLRDNVTLYLATGARLIATEKKECYTVRAEISDTGSQGTPMLIYGSKLNNISIKEMEKSWLNLSIIESLCHIVILLLMILRLLKGQMLI